MKAIKITGLFLLLSMAQMSCKKFSDLRQDPAAILNPTPSLVFTGVLLNIYDTPWVTTPGTALDQRDNQFMVLNLSYYGNQSYGSYWTTASYGDYAILQNVVQMETLAKNEGTSGAAYLALAKFFRAYFFVAMTNRFGDIPMSQALQGITNQNFTPKYDTQHDVYMQCLKLLDDANTALAPLVANGVTVNGDFFYNGNLAQWQKLVNSFRLRVLISLSKRAIDNPDLNIPQQFATIVNNPTQYPLILTNDDNFQLVYNSASVTNNYPLWPANGVVAQDKTNTLGATYVNILTKTRDPRIMVVAAPTDSAKNSGDPNYATEYTSYRGARTGDLQSTDATESKAGLISLINDAYWVAGPTGVPNIQLGAAETNFSIAEAINRGWVSGDAATYYNQGVSQSMQFYGVSSTSINTFLTNNAYAGNTQAGLIQILTQKYVAFFANSGREAYYNYRRTGVPTFDIGPSNDDENMIPTRWEYPTAEYQQNGPNLKASLQTQYGGADTKNGIMWLIK